MYVCVCHGVTDSDIEAAIDQGATTLEDLSDDLKVGTCCGRCADCANDMLARSIPRPGAMLKPGRAIA